MVNSPIALVFLHGFMEDARVWEHFTLRFSKSFSVYCPTLPGHGKTPLFFENPSMESYAEQVLTLLPPDGRFVFIGHSMGGYVALALATLFPNRVSGIVLMNSTCFADSEDRKAERNRSIELMRKNYSLFARSFVPFIFADAANPAIDAAIQLALEQDPRGMIQSTLAMRNRVSRCHKNLGRNFPVLLVAGRHDKLIDVSVMESIQENCPHVDVVWCESAGHMAFVEEPEICAEALNNWMLLKGILTA